MTEKTAYVALIGAPNAGKSTLLNQLVQAKVSIVSPKVQTTRFAIRGIRTVADTQLVFIDTPGIFEPKQRLDRAMVRAAWGGVSEADQLLMVLDARRGLCDQSRAIIARLKEVGRPAALVLNKVDMLEDKSRLLTLAPECEALFPFTTVYMVSALSGDGVEDVVKALSVAAKPGAWLYPPDQLTDLQSRVMAAELTREQLFLMLRQELPYGLTIVTDKWENLDNGDVKLWQTILVERESHKKIILGHRGEGIRHVGMKSREGIEAMMGCKVHLFLHIKVQEGWKDRPEHYADMGLDFRS